MLYIQLLTVYLVIGVTSISANSVNKLTFADLKCPGHLHPISDKCKDSVTQHQNYIAQCSQKAIDDAVSKVKSNKTDVQQILCDGEKIEEYECLDVNLINNCSAEDNYRLSMYMRSCFYYGVEQATGVKEWCFKNEQMKCGPDVQDDYEPHITEECENYFSKHDMEFADCVEKDIKATISKVKNVTDHDMIKKEVCDVEKSEEKCLDFLKPGCTKRDIGKLRFYIYDCTEYTIFKLTGATNYTCPDLNY